ncbi:MAG: ATPase domain-containing protein [Pirellulales bacterium]
MTSPSSSEPPRLSTGVPGLDERLGGGLLPGTLTVVLGAMGAGKTQLGLQFAEAGRREEGHAGVIFDMSTRGDPQSHGNYAARMFDWRLAEADATRTPTLAELFDTGTAAADYLHVFEQTGRRPFREEMAFEIWRDWKRQLVQRLGVTIAFFYGNFIRGVRAVVDGVEPVERPSDSIQFELFEYVYHQVIRKEAEWVARDLLRQDFRSHADEVAAHRYDPTRTACLLLYTSAETMLDPLIERQIDEGDLLSNANTVIAMGKIREGRRLGKALYVAKHRGSAASEEIHPYTISDRGIALLDD